MERQTGVEIVGTLEHRLKPFEMRWPKVKPTLLARSGMGRAKGLGARPCLECRRTFPGGMRNKHRRLRIAGSLQEMETLKTRHASQVAVALAPDLDEFGLAAGSNAKSIHGDEHGVWFLQEVIVRETSTTSTGSRAAHVRPDLQHLRLFIRHEDGRAAQHAVIALEVLVPQFHLAIDKLLDLDHAAGRVVGCAKVGIKPRGPVSRRDCAASSRPDT